MKEGFKQKKSEPAFNRKVLDRAFILPLIGIVLLLSPLTKIFQIDILINGIPFTLVYLFVVWGLLIAGAAYISRELRNQKFINKTDYTQDEIEQ